PPHARRGERVALGLGDRGALRRGRRRRGARAFAGNDRRGARLGAGRGREERMNPHRPLWNEPVLPIADLLARERRRQRQGRWIWGSFLALCVVAAIGLHAWLADPPIWSVRTLEIVGNRAVETQEIAVALDLHA